MKRLLTFATIGFLLVTFLTPLLECFDTWDRPGLTNDSELPVFLFILSIALILLVATIIAGLTLARHTATTKTRIVYEFFHSEMRAWHDIVIPPILSPPLRI
jgi:hypothetical protein